MTEEKFLPESARLYCPQGFTDQNDNQNGAWRNNDAVFVLSDVPHLSIAAHERMSKQMRDDLKLYFNNEGQVEWQGEKAGLVN